MRSSICGLLTVPGREREREKKKQSVVCCFISNLFVCIFAFIPAGVCNYRAWLKSGLGRQPLRSPARTNHHTHSCFLIGLVSRSGPRQTFRVHYSTRSRAPRPPGSSFNSGCSLQCLDLVLGHSFTVVQITETRSQVFTLHIQYPWTGHLFNVDHMGMWHTGEERRKIRERGLHILCLDRMGICHKRKKEKKMEN